MGVVGASIKGFGKALQRSYRLNRPGSRGKTITSVKPRVKVPGASAADIERSRQAGHTSTWAKRQKIAKGLDETIKAGKEAIKKRAHLGQTKVLKRHKGKYHEMKYSADHGTGAKDTLPWSAPVKKIRKTKKGKSVDDIPF